MRAALYARVSSKEQLEGYSIDAQKRAFKLLCQGRQWEPVGEYIDEGKSARTDKLNKRPAFRQSLADAQAHIYDILVVHKLDRFARNLRISIESLDTLGKAGVSFISINEQLDLSTPWGKMCFHVLGALAQFYSENLSQETKKGKNERKAQGLYNGLLPFGVMKGPDGLPKPHDEIWHVKDRNGQVIQERKPTYDGLKLAFQLAAQGETDKRIAQILNARGYRTAGTHGSNPFSKDTIGGILQNRFYIGELPDGKGGWTKGKHVPIIPPELFSAVFDIRARRRPYPQQSQGKDIVIPFQVLRGALLAVAGSEYQIVITPGLYALIVRIGVTAPQRAQHYRNLRIKWRPTFKPSNCQQIIESKCWHTAAIWKLTQVWKRRLKASKVSLTGLRTCTVLAI